MFFFFFKFELTNFLTFKFLFMKKFLLMITVTFLFSCSDNDEIMVQSKSISNESIFSRDVNSFDVRGLAEKVYYDIDFNNYVQAQFEMKEKLNMNVNFIEIYELKSDEELHVWVSNNLNKTSFLSEEEYVNKNLEIEILKAKFLKKFETKLEYFRGFNDFDKIFEFEMYQIASEEDEVSSVGRISCYTSANNCVKRARRNAAAGLGISAISAYFNPVIGAAGALGTYIYLQSALEACQDALDACLRN